MGDLSSLGKHFWFLLGNTDPVMCKPKGIRSCLNCSPYPTRLGLYVLPNCFPINFNSKILTFTRGTPPRTLSHSPPSLSSSSSSKRLDFLSCFFLALSSRFFSAAFLSSSVAGALPGDEGNQRPVPFSLRLLPPTKILSSAESCIQATLYKNDLKLTITTRTTKH